MGTKNKMPSQDSVGFIKTLNNMGYMTSTLDPFSQKIIDFAKNSSGPLLEIGAAYGVATLKALEIGCQVIANDLDERHLKILLERTPKQEKERLTLLPGKFPEEINIPQKSVGAILICRVLHFFNGQRIELAINKAFGWLKSGGKLAIIAETPYLKNFQNFIPIYEQRKKQGHPWPGFIEDTMEFGPDRGKFLPKQVHWLDKEVLCRAVEKVGFLIEEVSFIDRKDFPDDLRLDGRESVGLIARKP